LIKWYHSIAYLPLEGKKNSGRWWYGMECIPLYSIQFVEMQTMEPNSKPLNSITFHQNIA